MTAKPAIAFSFSKKAEPKRVVESLARPKPSQGESITCLEGGQVKTDAREAAAALLTIPCKNPLLEGQKTPKPAAPAAPAAPRANVATDADARQKDADALPGGLISRNIAQLSAADAEAARELLRDSAAAAAGGEAAAAAAPILMREGSKRVRDGQAAEASRDMFDNVPVESFGEALLRGMGYDPGKHTTKPVYHSKAHDTHLGLGAKALLPHEKMLLVPNKKNAAASKAAPAGTGAGRAQAVSQEEPAAAAPGVAASNGSTSSSTSVGGGATQTATDSATKRRRTDDAGSAAHGDAEAANGAHAQGRPRPDSSAPGGGDVWPSRGLVVRLISGDAALSDFYGVEAVVLEVDAESRCCRIKARVAGKTQVLPGVRIGDLETRVSRSSEVLRVVRGKRKGCVVKLVERDVKRNVARVSIEGKESEIPLDDLCQFVA